MINDPMSIAQVGKPAPEFTVEGYTPDGMLRYALYHDNGVGRSVAETLRVLEGLQTGELCPANWHKGEKTLGKA